MEKAKSDYRQYWDNRKDTKDMTREECGQELELLQNMDAQPLNGLEDQDRSIRIRELYTRINELNPSGREEQ